MNQKNNKAFTLVELIVVITILSILGTIAFISLQGYSASARDSKRISDISNIKKSLELFSINSGKYPEPDFKVTVSYGIQDLWYQGTVGDNVTINLSRNLNEKPLDPLTETPYTYSRTYSGNEYELLSIYESDLISQNNNVLNNTNAANSNYPKIDGNYNGVYVKAGITYIPTPTIINALNINLDLVTQTGALESQIITGGENNISNAGIEAKIGLLTGIIVNAFSGELDTTKGEDGNGNKAFLAQAIIDTYSGTNLSTSGIYKEIVETVDLISLVDNYVLNKNNFVNTTTSNALMCNEGEHTEDGINCVLDIGTCPIINGTGIKTWNGTSWDCIFNSCNSGYTQEGENCVANIYTVTFDGNGGTLGTTTVTPTYNSVMPTLLTAPTRLNYTFIGYFNEASGGTKYYNQDKSSANVWNIEENTILYAQWLGDNHELTLDANGGSLGTTSVIFEYGSDMPILENIPIKDGYVFDGYYNSVYGKIKYYNADSTSSRKIYFSENTTLYAQWSQSIPSCMNSGDIEVASTTYLGCNTKDIIVCSGIGAGYILSACNVGATTAGVTSYGKFFQAGENVAWDYSSNVSTTNNCFWDRNTQVCGSSALSAWSKTVSDTIIGGNERWYDYGDLRGPCAVGYHVGSQSEWVKLIEAGNWALDGAGMINSLKTPLAGRRNYVSGVLEYDTKGYYWYSTPYASTTSSFTTIMSFSDTYVSVTSSSYNRAFGLPIRCIKD